MAVMVCTVTACAATGRIYTPATPLPGQGLIYVYRLSAIQGGGGNWPFVANGVQELKVGNAGYYVYHAKPGNVTFSSIKPVFGSPTDFITIYVEPGEVYFVRFTMNVFTGSLSKVPFFMELVDRSIGEAEIRNLRMTE
jgi:hypothetical protein